jgi:hypothetical protein
MGRRKHASVVFDNEEQGECACGGGTAALRSGLGGAAGGEGGGEVSFGTGDSIEAFGRAEMGGPAERLGAAGLCCSPTCSGRGRASARAAPHGDVRQRRAPPSVGHDQEGRVLDECYPLGALVLWRTKGELECICQQAVLSNFSPKGQLGERAHLCRLLNKSERVQDVF